MALTFVILSEAKDLCPLEPSRSLKKAEMLRSAQHDSPIGKC